MARSREAGTPLERADQATRELFRVAAAVWYRSAASPSALSKIKAQGRARFLAEAQIGYAGQEFKPEDLREMWRLLHISDRSLSHVVKRAVLAFQAEARRG